MTTVSVIVPVYGVEKYISRCAHSLFAQTLEDIEFIFIDDCTPDNSITVLKSILAQYPKRIGQTRIERMPHNSGLAAVRKYGISLAKGEYIIACDSDDYVEKDMYETMYNAATVGNYDLVQCDIDVVDDNSVLYTLSSNKERVTSEILKDDIICGIVSNSLCNKLVKRELYYNEELVFPTVGMDEDNAMAIQLAYYANRLLYIKKAFYKAYQNLGSISRGINEEKVLARYEESITNSRLIIEFLLKHGYDNTFPIIKAKLRPKIALFPVLHNKKNMRLWRNTYPEINSCILFDRRLSLKIRVQSFCALFGIYPFLDWMCKICGKSL